MLAIQLLHEDYIVPTKWILLIFGFILGKHLYK
jgi:hypothetical protein